MYGQILPDIECKVLLLVASLEMGFSFFFFIIFYNYRFMSIIFLVFKFYLNSSWLT